MPNLLRQTCCAKLQASSIVCSGFFDILQFSFDGLQASLQFSFDGLQASSQFSFDGLQASLHRGQLIAKS